MRAISRMSTNNNQYNPWGFKLNLMYASIPPRYYRNLRDFNEFNTPRIDIGMLAASLYEQEIYGPNPHFLPRVADKFYEDQRNKIAAIVTNTLLDVGVIANSNEIEFRNGIQFVPPTQEVAAGAYYPEKKYPLFILYVENDTEGDANISGVPFLRVALAKLKKSGKHRELYNWSYEEIRIGRGYEQYQYEPFIAPPLFVAYLKDTYANLDFDYYDPKNISIYEKYSRYFRVDESLKKPYKDFVNRESISEPNEYGEFVIHWDKVPANRSIVAAHNYYDWDDDFQSAQVEAQITARITKLEREISDFRKKL